MAARSAAKIGGMLLVLMLLAACGDADGVEESSFDGVYRVASHTRSLGDCEKEGVATSEGDSFFKLAKNDGKLSYQPCDSAQDCSGVDRNRQFTQQVDGEWVGVRANASERREACNAQLAERIASRTNGDNIQIEIRHYRGEFERDEKEECSEALVVSNRDALGCYQRDIIKATPVAQP